VSFANRSWRLVHVIRTLDPAFGGPPVVCTHLARAQMLSGHAVEILTGDDGKAPPGGDVPVRTASAPGPFDLLVRGRGRRALAEHVARAEVLHLHGVWDPLLLGAAAEARRVGVRYVVTPHGMLDPWSLAQKQWKKRVALALGVRRMLNGAAALHLLNSAEAQLLAPLRLRPVPCIVPNGVDLGGLDPLPDPGEFRAAHPGLGHDPYVLFLSRLHYKKGLDVLASAFARVAPQHPRVKLVVAGPDGGERQAFSQQIATLALTNRVVLTGPIFGRAKWAALAGAACFCLPSRQEGFSMAVLEALACRVPVVISEQCHFPEVGGSGAGVIAPLDPGAIAAGITRILADPRGAAEMGSAGRGLVEARYTWDKVVAGCDHIYGHCADRSEPPAHSSGPHSKGTAAERNSAL
jgi:glycosyltransferase involved in cell wall biosynthesis